VRWITWVLYMHDINYYECNDVIVDAKQDRRKIKYNISANLGYMWIKCALHQILHAYLIIYLAQTTIFLQQLIAHPINFPCGTKQEYPEKTHDFRQSVDWIAIQP
jgi:hypothetical protein